MHRAPTISFDDSVCPAGSAFRAARFAVAAAVALASPSPCKRKLPSRPRTPLRWAPR